MMTPQNPLDVGQSNILEFGPGRQHLRLKPRGPYVMAWGRERGEGKKGGQGTRVSTRGFVEEEKNTVRSILCARRLHMLHLSG